MYRLMIFLKKTDNEPLVNHFKDVILKYLREMSGQDIELAKVEGSSFMEDKYRYYCEISADSKEDIDKMMVSPIGRKFTREITSFVNDIVMFYANYNTEK